MNNRIYLFANFGDWNKQPYGGGEVGNRRTLRFLQKAGFEIVIIDKFKKVLERNLLKRIWMLWLSIWNLFEFFGKLLFARRRKAVVHIVGFYGTIVYFEAVLVVVARMLGYKVLYEMRGGGADVFYHEGGFVYKSCFNCCIRRAHYILSQGKENYQLIETIAPDRKVYYYPNCISEDFYPASYPVKPQNRVNMIYFGRISATKNVDIVLEAFVNVAKKHDNVYLDIVGNCPETAYAESVRVMIEESGFSDRIKMYPACNHKKLKEHIMDKHIYLFPTSEPHEGHSNALTEAMSWGLVPIATGQGFNKSVVNNDRLIVKDLSVGAFTDCVERLIESGELSKFSKEVYSRVQENYTDAIVYEQLKGYYDSIFMEL